MSVELTIKMVQASNTFSVNISKDATVEELKEQIATKASLPKDHIRLVCAGRIWQDSQTVGSYEPRDGAMVHCLNNPPRTSVPAAEQTLAAVNPMQGLMGSMPAAGASSGDPMAQMMAQSQQMMAQNPEMIQQLMDSPMMQQMMSNPEMMRMMMRMNPQMNELMEQRPEIARMLEDPEVLRQSMQMIRNPSLMREMQRNADLSMGRLDVMPGGQAALMRAHEDVVNPLMNALSGSGDAAAADIPEYTQQAQGAPNTAALPNAWGAPPPVAAQAPAPTAAPVTRPAATVAPSVPAAAPALTPAVPGGMAANPMGAMMQQMMANPEMMQQSMQMAQQMFGGQGAFGGPGAATTQAPATTPAATTPGATAPAATSAMGPLAAMMGMQPGAAPGASPNAGAAANPMAGFQQQMMQQMLTNPAMMQASLQMAQSMYGGQHGGLMGQPPANANPMAAMMQQMMGGMPAANTGAEAGDATADVANNPMVRARFASQLSQLSAMGFSNEQACLRALVQHQGRVDAVIDTLLASGESNS